MDYQDKGIEELNLSRRAYNSLTRAGIDTVRDVMNCTTEDFTKIRTLGRKRCRRSTTEKLMN